jgi:pimeloyl-ACP methyl ester carboxylesterase
MFRARFKKQIVAEFLPPVTRLKTQKVIILCDGMPSIPRKQPLVEFLASKNFWVIYPRYRGAWESDGRFLEKPPDRDISDILDELPRGLKDISFGQRFSISPDEIYVIGGSFGGATAILSSLDKRVTKVVANCPVVDWSILSEAEGLETSNRNYAAYIREAFGNGYRLSDANWAKLRTGKFFSPWKHRHQLEASKILLFHAKDDPHVPYARTRQFAELTGIRLKTLQRGGHIRTEYVVRKYWSEISRFFGRP